MQLSGISSTSVQGLRAANTRLSVSAHDIANATTDKFSQRDIIQTETAPQGVKVAAIRPTDSPTDLAKEFGAELTYAKVGYGTNLKVIETQDQMLGTLLDLKG